mmetsp:Transcript_13354/g.41945  ORF Transcript_13354/g.41945 Transcript_13354/m.41945 type:complete len:329 (+) Transcript_13354:115-1101(+)
MQRGVTCPHPSAWGQSSVAAAPLPGWLGLLCLRRWGGFPRCRSCWRKRREGICRHLHATNQGLSLRDCQDVHEIACGAAIGIEVPVLLDSALQLVPPVRPGEVVAPYHLCIMLHCVLQGVDVLQLLVPGLVCDDACEARPVLENVLVPKNLFTALQLHPFSSPATAPHRALEALRERRLVPGAFHRHLFSRRPLLHHLAHQQSAGVQAVQAATDRRVKQHLQHSQGLRVDDVVQVRRVPPILQVREELNEGRILEVVLRGQPLHVLRVRQALHKLQLLDEASGPILNEVLQAWPKALACHGLTGRLHGQRRAGVDRRLLICRFRLLRT